MKNTDPHDNAAVLRSALRTLKRLEKDPTNETIQGVLRRKIETALAKATHDPAAADARIAEHTAKIASGMIAMSTVSPADTRKVRAYITKSKAGHYTVTIKRGFTVLDSRRLLSSLEKARWIKDELLREHA